MLFVSDLWSSDSDSNSGRVVKCNGKYLHWPQKNGNGVDWKDYIWDTLCNTLPVACLSQLNKVSLEKILQYFKKSERIVYNIYEYDMYEYKRKMQKIYFMLHYLY